MHCGADEDLRLAIQSFIASSSTRAATYPKPTRSQHNRSSSALAKAWGPMSARSGLRGRPGAQDLDKQATWSRSRVFRGRDACCLAKPYTEPTVHAVRMRLDASHPHRIRHRFGLTLIPYSFHSRTIRAGSCDTFQAGGPGSSPGSSTRQVSGCCRRRP